MNNTIKIILIAKAFLTRKSLSEVLLEEFNHIELLKEIKDYDSLMSIFEKESNCIVIADSSLVKNFERYFEKLPINLVLITLLESVKDREHFNKYKEFITLFDDRKMILEIVQRAVNSLPSQNINNLELKLLSDREMIILQFIAKGFSSKMIADKLCISIQTVSTHRKNISNKLEIKTVSGLTLYAIVNNLIKPEETNLI